MDDFGNGVAVAVKALQDDFDLIDVFWCAALEAARLYGVVDAGVHRHGGQAQGGTQAEAVNSHLVDTVFHRSEAVRRRVSRGHSPCPPIALPASSTGQARHRGLQHYKAMAVSSKLNWIKVNQRDLPSMVSSGCLR
jgi:hypothetical protein